MYCGLAPFVIGRIGRDQPARLRRRRQHHLDVRARNVRVRVHSGRDALARHQGERTGSLEDANQLVAKFLVPGADLPRATQSLKPRLEDLRAIFDQPFADRAYRHDERTWTADSRDRSEGGSNEAPVQADTSDWLRRSAGSTSLPGGYKTIVSEFRPGRTI